MPFLHLTLLSGFLNNRWIDAKLVWHTCQRRSWLFSKGHISEKNSTGSCSGHRAGVYTVEAIGVSCWAI